VLHSFLTGAAYSIGGAIVGGVSDLAHGIGFGVSNWNSRWWRIYGL